jgi:DNA polymerase-3 subunit alpha
MGLEVLGPDVNESHYKLPLTIIMRAFWDGAIKGWAGAVATIVQIEKTESTSQF